uniref:Uncharacterized protein n=1 Tax=Oryza brachyantha TaxID=4533 RepID=J3LES4_ORYBR
MGGTSSDGVNVNSERRQLLGTKETNVPWTARHTSSTVSSGGGLWQARPQICLHMHDPWESHLATRKRIICYVHDIVDYGLHIHRSTTVDLTAYSDDDWVGSLDTRKSTLGYVVFLSDNLVS